MRNPLTRLAQSAIIFTVVTGALSLVGLASCQNPATSADTPILPELNALITNLPEASFQIPESLENAQSSTGVRSAARSAYDSTGEEGVIGLTMWDLMYNHLIEMANPDLAEEVNSWGTVFLKILKEVAVDPQYNLSKGSEIDLGIRSFPAGSQGPNGEVSLDMGTLFFEETSETVTNVYWIVPFSEVPGAPLGGVYYINLEILELDDAGNIEMVTRLAFRPNDPDGLMDIFVQEVYERMNSLAEGTYFYNVSDDEVSTFQQYTDSNGMLRTFFNADVGRETMDYDLLFLMIGDESCAGIDSYTRVVRDDNNLAGTFPTPVSQRYETYNENGQLLGIAEINLDTYTYPLLTLEKAGYSLRTNSGEYWMEADGNDIYNVGTDINLTYSSLGTVTLDYDGSNPDYDPDNPTDSNFNPGYYMAWTGDKNFESRTVDLYMTSSKLNNLDSSEKIGVIEGYLSDWFAELTNTDLDNGDIITLPDSTTLLADLGFPMDPSDFPTP